MLRTCCSLLLLAVAGCDSPVALTQRLAGEWVGRPETAAERILREWPGRLSPSDTVDPESPEVAKALANTPATDLELAAPDVRVTMKLSPRGKAELTLADRPKADGTWDAIPLEGRRAQLEITVEAAQEAARGGELVRRFDLEWLADDKGFTLRESGADRRFGRLLFTRPDDARPAAATGEPGPVPEAGDPSPEPEAGEP